MLDGDGIRAAQALLEADPEAFRGYIQCVLTPNAMEFRRLWLSAFPEEDQPPPPFDVVDEDTRARDQLFEPFVAAAVSASAGNDSIQLYSGILQPNDPCAEATVRLARR